MAPFLPIRATSRSQAVRIGKQTVKTGTTTYVDVGSQTESGGIKAGSSLPYSPFKELQNHLAIGAIIVVGPLSSSTSDWVETTALGGKVTVEKEKEETETELAVAAGEIVQRSTSTKVATEGKTKVKLKEPTSKKERIDLVAVSETTGAIKVTEGVAAAEKAAVAPALPAGEYLVATVTSIDQNKKAVKVVDDRTFA